ncbi:MAG: hypothetical protein J1E82_09550 [Muribaculaceae bacterium]|nr:hypothetical protein [Muribaculaceae bacterium]
MKKKVLGFIVAIAAIASGSIYAQNQSCNNQQGEQKECCKEAKKDKKDKKDKGGKKMAEKPRFNAFEGIQLTDNQQQKLQELRKGLGPVKLTDEQKKNLTDDQKKQMKAEAKAKKADAKKNYLNGVKEILTEQQYVIFLENNYLNGPGSQKFKGNKPFKANKDMKGKGPKGKKGDKKEMSKKDGKKADKGSMANKDNKKGKSNKKAQKA